jgi:Pyridoxamine 5'-phosphate oxidase
VQMIALRHAAPPKGRNVNAMSCVHPDLEAHLSTQGRTFMATIRKDGSPTCHPMGTFYADGELYLNMYAKSAKHRNLSRDPRICCLVTTTFEEGRPRAAVFRGTARLLPVEEVLTDDPRPAVRKALVIGDGTTEGGSRYAANEDPEGFLKRTTAMRARIRDGGRVLWQVQPAEIAWLDDVRGV